MPVAPRGRMVCGELKALALLELTLPQSEIPWSPGRSAAEVFAFVVAHGEHVFPVDTFTHFASVILLPPRQISLHMIITLFGVLQHVMGFGGCSSHIWPSSRQHH